jgi:membrane carboxypeptidase/penicillin-binding protein
MGYQQGEIPMLSVHGYEVAGATFPVPIWHEYMAAALWHRPAIDFATPDKYPNFRYFTKGDWGSLRSYYTPTYSTTTAATTTTPAPPQPKPHGKQKLRPGPH